MPAFKATEAVTIGGEEYTLAIDIAIIDALEDEFDCSFDEIMAQFQGKVRVGRLARLIRGLLSRHHPEMTLDDVAGLVMADAEAFGEGMTRLFTKAQPQGDAKPANPRKPRRGTGARS